eukprot:762562-Hanusia_phi.AAC.1
MATTGLAMSLLMFLLSHTVDSGNHASYISPLVHLHSSGSSKHPGSKLLKPLSGPLRIRISYCCALRRQCQLSMKSDNVPRRKTSSPQRHSQLRHIDEIFKRDEDDSSRLYF